MARPWPDRYTRARLGLLKGFIVRPRMGPIRLDSAELDVIVGHGGWNPPFTDEDGEPNLADGVNPGQPLTLSVEDPGALYRFTDGEDSGPRYNVNGDRARREGHHRHGVIDWRSADGKRVVSWAAVDRYGAAGAASIQLPVRIWYKGRHVGTVSSDRVVGACIHTDPATGTSWLVVVTFTLDSQFRENNDYTEAVWMRPLGLDLQTEITTPQDIDALILEAEDPALSQAQKQEKIDEIQAELRKWQQVAEIDADPLLPDPPTGDPKVAPVEGDVGNWLFNASGDECQTIRAVMASKNGTFDPGSWEIQDRQRLKINLAYTITEQDVAGTTIRRPAASIAQAQAFDTLTGTVASTHAASVSDTEQSKEIFHQISGCTGDFQQVVMRKDSTEDLTEDESWTSVIAVDYVGDQEVLASFSFLRHKETTITVSADKKTLDRCGDPDWAEPQGSSEATFFALVSSETLTWSWDFNGLLLSTTGSVDRSVQQNGTPTELPALQWEYDVTTGPDGTAPTGTEILDETQEGLVIRHLDLRDGILHYVLTSETIEDDTDSNEEKVKSAEEIASINGLAQSLQTDSDSVSTDNTSRQTIRFDADPPEVDDSSQVPATLQNITTSAGNYYGQIKRSVGWAGDGEGVYVGSALLGEAFQPYGASGPGPHGHESVFNRYDGAGQSIQDLFGIQAVNPGDEFVCYPVAFVGK